MRRYYFSLYKLPFYTVELLIHFVRSARNKKKYYHQDRIAMRLAARVGLTYEYKLSRRRYHRDPIEALEDWDLLYPEDYNLFELSIN